MTIPTATISLTYDPSGPNENAITLASPAAPYSPEAERSQVIGRTASGSYYAYDKETMNYQLRLDLVVTAAQKAAMITWFTSKVRAGLRTFTLTDHLGNALAGCRLATTTLLFTKTPGGRYRVTLEIVTPSTAV